MSSNRNQTKTGAKRKMEGWIIKEPDKDKEGSFPKIKYPELDEPLVRTTKRQRKDKKIFDPSENEIAPTRRKPIVKEEQNPVIKEEETLPQLALQNTELTGTIGDKSFKIKNLCVDIERNIVCVMKSKEELKNVNKNTCTIKSREELQNLNIKIEIKSESPKSNIDHFVDTARDVFDDAIKQEIDIDIVTDCFMDGIVKQEVDLQKDPIGVNDEPQSIVEVNADGSVTVRPISSKKSVPCKECPACLLLDCGDCNQCLDKKKFGVWRPISSKKSLSCKECPACLLLDCGACKQCLDKKKFGGPGKLKQRCLKRYCHKYADIGKVPSFAKSHLSNIVKISHNEEKIVQLPDTFRKYPEKRLNEETFRSKLENIRRNNPEDISIKSLNGTSSELQTNKNKQYKEVFQCPECEKYFLNTSLYDIHVESQHSKFSNSRELLTCRLCNRDLIRRNVEHHVEKFHSDLNPVPNFDDITKKERAYYKERKSNLTYQHESNFPTYQRIDMTTNKTIQTYQTKQSESLSLQHQFCNDCKKYFLDANLYDIHIESQHSIKNPEELLICRLCSSEVIRRNVEHHVQKFHSDLNPVPNFNNITNGLPKQVLSQHRLGLPNRVPVPVQLSRYPHFPSKPRNPSLDKSSGLENTIGKTSSETFWHQVTDNFERETRLEDRNVILDIKRFGPSANNQNLDHQLEAANKEKFPFYERENFEKSLNISSNTPKEDTFRKLKEKLFFAQHFNNHNYYKQYQKNNHNFYKQYQQHQLGDLANTSQSKTDETPIGSYTDIGASNATNIQKEKQKGHTYILPKRLDWCEKPTRIEATENQDRIVLEGIKDAPQTSQQNINSIVDCEEENEPLLSQIQKISQEQQKLMEIKKKNREKYKPKKYDNFYEKILPSSQIKTSSLEHQSFLKKSSTVVIKKFVNPQVKNKLISSAATKQVGSKPQTNLFPYKVLMCDKNAPSNMETITQPVLPKDKILLKKDVICDKNAPSSRPNEIITQPFIPDKSINLPKGCQILSVTKKPTSTSFATSTTSVSDHFTSAEWKKLKVESLNVSLQKKLNPYKFQGVFAQSRKPIIKKPSLGSTGDVVESLEEANSLQFKTEMAKSKAIKLVDKHVKNQTTFQNVHLNGLKFVQSLAKSYGIEYIEK